RGARAGHAGGAGGDRPAPGGGDQHRDDPRRERLDLALAHPPRSLKSLQVAVGFLVSLVVLAVLLWQVDLAALGEHLARTHLGWVAVTAGLYIVGVGT